MRIFEVYENEHFPSRIISGPSWGAFTNFAAADNFVRDMFTPEYDRHLVIVETEARDTYPTNFLSEPNTLTYYHQIAGEMVPEI